MIHEIARAAGSHGMVGGQVVDMESEGKADVDLAIVQYIHTHKTGALLKASVKGGALLGGADDAGLAAMTRYGEAIGLAFQIADDILDIEGTTEEIGKDAGQRRSAWKGNLSGGGRNCRGETAGRRNWSKWRWKPSPDFDEQGRSPEGNRQVHRLQEIVKE